MEADAIPSVYSCRSWLSIPRPPNESFRLCALYDIDVVAMMRATLSAHSLSYRPRYTRWIEFRGNVARLLLMRHMSHESDH